MSSLAIASGALNVTLRPPYYPYQVTWRTAAYISRASDGQANVFDPGAAHDSWEFDGNFRCTPAQAATLGAIFRANLDVQIYPDGFSPFGPLHADTAYTVKMKVCEHGQILENPYRMYAVRLVFELTSALTSITAPAGKVEGAFALGSVSDLRMPGSVQDIWRAVRVLDRSGGHPAMAKTENPWTDSTLSIEGREANICRVMGYLEAQRYSNLTATSQDKYFLFGAEIGNGLVTAKRVSNEITYSMIEHDAWSFDLPLNFRSIVPLPTPGDYTLLYLDESDISMLTADGSSGASTYQLTPVFDDPLGVPTACSWSSSNPSAIAVSSSGLCTCVGAGTATITATKDAVSKTCSVTGFATMPSVASLYALKGGKGGDVTGALSVLVNFEYAGALPFKARAHRTILKTFTSATNTASFEAFVQQGYWGCGSLLNNATAVTIYGEPGVAYRYGGPYSANTKYSLDLAVLDGVFYSDGVQKTVTSSGSEPNTTTGLIRQRYTNNCEKIVLQSWNDAATTLADTLLISANKIFYTPQDYIRYTNITGRTNFTKIPNRGTLGNTYDLVQNNVPSGWFAV
jgi:hypothetical protein